MCENLDFRLQFMQRNTRCSTHAASRYRQAGAYLDMRGPLLESPSQGPKSKALRNTQQEPALTGLPAGIAAPGLACPPQQDDAHAGCQAGRALMHSMTR